MQLPAGALPIAEELAATCLSLPLYPGISEKQVQAVAAAICSFTE
ncbi:DegT/DnrJ/EryC1/StrS family aminotransferase [Hymenobacter amundsenii]|nr:DegT/DnrJ/EryC1/StrS family aminotransferase [Hymenobacter amundsenii]